MRLIDAGALKKKAQMRGHVSKKTMVTDYHMCVSTHDIDNAPTVDAEPVKHAHWIAVDEYVYRAKEFKCSVCENTVEYGYYTSFCDYNYCPNCGAKMDAEVE